MSRADADDMRVFLVVCRGGFRDFVAPSQFLDEIGGFHAFAERMCGVGPKETVWMRVEPGRSSGLRRHHRESKTVAGYKMRSNRRQACEQSCADPGNTIAGEGHGHASFDRSREICNFGVRVP